MKGLEFIATGRALGSKVVTNDDFAKVLDTSDEWIFSRTGIHERHICQDQTNLDLAVEAGRQAMDRAGISPQDVGLCVVATFSPDFCTPATACLVQKRLGLPTDIASFDMNGACTGFLDALHVARGLLLQQERPYGLVIGSELISRVLDFTDRSTCVLFGDGAGAAVVRLADKAYTCCLGSNGDEEMIWAHGPGKEVATVHMNGSAVYRFAVETVPRTALEVLDKAGLTLEDVDWFVPHQANRRIVEAAARRLKTPLDKWYLNMEHYGNMSAATIPIAIDEMDQKGLLKRGQKLLLLGFGAGLTWGGTLLEW